MFRVRNQIGCTKELVDSCGKYGVTVAMLDTGIAQHPDFDKRIIAFKDFVNHKQVVYDDSGHGTHVAGCICGNGRLSDGKFAGIAPASRLVVGKVLNCEIMKLLSNDTIQKNSYVYEINGIAKEVYSAEGVIVVNLGSEVYLINETGWLIKKYTSSQEIKDVVISENIVGIIYRNKIEFISL